MEVITYKGGRVQTIDARDKSVTESLRASELYLEIDQTRESAYGEGKGLSWTGEN